ncbi:hypothetical protein T281_10390 [Rhodomicrobium udaipurense JA643]|uniref:Uncharacterized protein n=1 Tax=Rhodomicrobium udaipurense TaxID=1202716 RepID=A0A8I1GC67_9HYPH|nr:hypothetical protein [Rhodomicrobium udaipurense]KAI94554.1 hypothetical protein T281_10390 [Rhodomicrobium udaipurense JA643]MBJ7544383.1 hypothetical protein [Rhodomicrobium udaipurense]
MPAPPVYRRVFSALALLVGLAPAICAAPAAADRLSNACTKWPQNTLIIGHDLQSRRFLLEPFGEPAEAMPFFPSSAGRSTYHKPFALYLDVSDRIGVFTSRAPRTCVLARDGSQQSPMKVPVFFVGRQGASLEDLKEDAEMVAFAPSKLLDFDTSFADVSFRLKRGGSRFDEIRPFFLCGVPALLVCQSSCPPDSVTLGASLVNDLVLSRQTATARVEQPRTVAPEKRLKAPPPINMPSVPETPVEPKPEPKPEPKRQSEAKDKPAPSLPPAPTEQPRRELPPALTQPAPVAPPPTPSLITPPPKTPPAPQQQAPAPKADPARPTPPPEAALPADAKPADTKPTPEPVAPPEVGKPAPQDRPAPSAEAEKAAPLPEALPAPQPYPYGEEERPTAAPQTPQAAPQAPAAPAPAPPVLPAAQPQEAPPPASDDKPTEAPPPSAAPPADIPAPTPQAAATTRRLTLVFRRQSGELFPAEDVLRAEGSISIDGKILTPTPVGLVADLPEASFKRVQDPAYLEMQMPHFRIGDVKTEGQRVVVTVDPLFMRAADLAIRITGATGEPVRGCDLALDVSMNRRIGEGWPKFQPQQRPRGLPFTVSDGSAYRLRLPPAVDAGELLISTAEAGAAAIILNGPSAPMCELEARPLVTAQEIRDGTITRSLQRVGSTFITVLSADSKLAESIGAVAVEATWTDVFDLVRTVSSARYEKKVLARAQAGVNLDTKKVDVKDGATPLADGSARNDFLRELIAASHVNPAPEAIFEPGSLERYYLDTALDVIRAQAGVVTRSGVKQETLLVVTGDVKDEKGSYFCQEPVSRDADPFGAPKWLRLARRTFALEIWSEDAARSMLHVSRIRPAPSAPEGVYVCRMPGSHTDKIALYGVLPSVLQDDAKRARAFAYLTEQAKAFLRP